MSGTLMTYTSNAIGTGSLDSTNNLSNPISLSGYQKLKLKVDKFIVSGRIPNILTVGTYTNGLLRISNNANILSPTWLDIQLNDGQYTIGYLQNAINTIASGLGWYTNPTQPALTIKYNLATLMTYITIDSSLLAIGTQFGIDLNPSDISLFLGYTTGPKKFITDGVFGSDSPALIQWYGDSILCWIEGFGSLTIFNKVSNNLLCKVPIVVSSSTGLPSSLIQYPLGLPSPTIFSSSANDRIDKYTVRLTGNRRIGNATGNGDSYLQYVPLYCMYGGCELTFSVDWSKT